MSAYIFLWRAKLRTTSLARFPCFVGVQASNRKNYSGGYKRDVAASSDVSSLSRMMMYQHVNVLWHRIGWE